MAFSERRVARTKQFLIEKGIAQDSIETRGLGSEEQLTATREKEMLEQNHDLSAAERGNTLRDLNVIVFAQNRRVDVVLSTTNQQSVRQFPFNAADALTPLDKSTSAHSKKTPEHSRKAAAKRK